MVRRAPAAAPTSWLPALLLLLALLHTSSAEGPSTAAGAGNVQATTASSKQGRMDFFGLHVSKPHKSSSLKIKKEAPKPPLLEPAPKPQEQELPEPQQHQQEPSGLDGRAADGSAPPLHRPQQPGTAPDAADIPPPRHFEPTDEQQEGEQLLSQPVDEEEPQLEQQRPKQQQQQHQQEPEQEQEDLRQEEREQWQQQQQQEAELPVAGSLPKPPRWSQPKPQQPGTDAPEQRQQEQRQQLPEPHMPHPPHEQQHEQQQRLQERLKELLVGEGEHHGPRREQQQRQHEERQDQHQHHPGPDAADGPDHPDRDSMGPGSSPHQQPPELPELPLTDSAPNRPPLGAPKLPQHDQPSPGPSRYAQQQPQEPYQQDPPPPHPHDQYSARLEPQPQPQHPDQAPYSHPHPHPEHNQHREPEAQDVDYYPHPQPQPYPQPEPQPQPQPQPQPKKQQQQPKKRQYSSSSDDDNDQDWNAWEKRKHDLQQRLKLRQEQRRAQEARRRKQQDAATYEPQHPPKQQYYGDDAFWTEGDELSGGAGEGEGQEGYQNSRDNQRSGGAEDWIEARKGKGKSKRSKQKQQQDPLKGLVPEPQQQPDGSSDPLGQLLPRGGSTPEDPLQELSQPKAGKDPLAHLLPGGKAPKDPLEQLTQPKTGAGSSQQQQQPQQGGKADKQPAAGGDSTQGNDPLKKLLPGSSTGGNTQKPADAPQQPKWAAAKPEKPAEQKKEQQQQPQERFDFFDSGGVRKPKLPKAKPFPADKFAQHSPSGRTHEEFDAFKEDGSEHGSEAFELEEQQEQRDPEAAARGGENWEEAQRGAAGPPDAGGAREGLRARSRWEAEQQQEQEEEEEDVDMELEGERGGSLLDQDAAQEADAEVEEEVEAEKQEENLQQQQQQQQKGSRTEEPTDPAPRPPRWLNPQANSALPSWDKASLQQAQARPKAQQQQQQQQQQKQQEEAEEGEPSQLEYAEDPEEAELEAALQQEQQQPSRKKQQQQKQQKQQDQESEEEPEEEELDESAASDSDSDAESEPVRDPKPQQQKHKSQQQKQQQHSEAEAAPGPEEPSSSSSDSSALSPEDPQQPSSSTPLSCSDVQQILACGQMPVATSDDIAAHRECCRMYAPRRIPAGLLPPPPEKIDVERWDLETRGPLTQRLEWYFAKKQGACTAEATAKVPAFGPNQTVTILEQSVPELAKQQIVQIKSAAMLQRKWIRARYNKIHAAARTRTPGRSQFKHPGGFAGAAELALIQWRLKGSRQPQMAALGALLNGTGVPAKVYHNGSVVWHPPVDTPLDYDEPLPMKSVQVGYGGFNKAASCPRHYPASAPWAICSHVAFVEMDAQMSYKQAMAHLATRNEAYATNMLAIVSAWALNNKEWGLTSENGPLEAAWGVAAMARSLEMLKGTEMGPDLAQDWTDATRMFVRWYKGVVHPQMQHYVDVITQAALYRGVTTVYGNWHSSIAEAWMAVGVLTDNVTLWDQGVELYEATVHSYLRWGRYKDWKAGRVLGECSETLRDIYHTQFGLGGLLQAAEMAWQQNLDLYKADGYALASAMEFHARVINAWDAGKDESLLPPGYRFFETSMPPAPAGMDWVFDIQAQKWFARDRATKKTVGELKDGFKYLLGVKYMPTGWELGYNHYAGRLGMQLPETTQLLRRYKVDWAEFHWGLGTLSHANSASLLWRPGVTQEVVCDKNPIFKSAEAEAEAEDDATQEETTQAVVMQAAPTAPQQQPQQQERLLSQPQKQQRLLSQPQPQQLKPPQQYLAKPLAQSQQQPVAQERLLSQPQQQPQHLKPAQQYLAKPLAQATVQQAAPSPVKVVLQQAAAPQEVLPQPSAAPTNQALNVLSKPVGQPQAAAPAAAPIAHKGLNLKAAIEALSVLSGRASSKPATTAQGMPQAAGALLSSQVQGAPQALPAAAAAPAKGVVATAAATADDVLAGLQKAQQGAGKAATAAATKQHKTAAKESQDADSQGASGTLAAALFAAI